MSGFLSLFSGKDNLAARKNAELLLETNDYTRQYGLALTHTDALSVVEARDIALRDYGRVELGVGMTDRLIMTFCDSPYLNSENYAETVCALTELFYYMKGETFDRLTDDELLQLMKRYFDGECGGSLELLAERELETTARNIRAYGSLDVPDENENITADYSGEYPIEEDGSWRSIHL